MRAASLPGKSISQQSLPVVSRSRSPQVLGLLGDFSDHGLVLGFGLAGLGCGSQLKHHAMTRHNHRFRKGPKLLHDGFMRLHWLVALYREAVSHAIAPNSQTLATLRITGLAGRAIGVGIGSGA